MTPELYFISVLCLVVSGVSAVVLVSLCMLASWINQREEAVKLDREHHGLPR